MSLARLSRLFLAAALLAVWQGALVHPIQHVDEHGGLVHVAGVLGTPDSEGGEAGALCDAIAAVIACVDGGAIPVFLPSSGSDGCCKKESTARGSALALAYRSQAPPRHS